MVTERLQFINELELCINAQLDENCYIMIESMVTVHV
jgi:hypothetical protein